MPKQVSAYQCLYCEGVGLHEEDVKQQEDICLHNPHFQCCYNCLNGQKVTVPRSETEKPYAFVCVDPYPEDETFDTPHEYGWCPNYERDEKYNNYGYVE